MLMVKSSSPTARTRIKLYFLFLVDLRHFFLFYFLGKSKRIIGSTQDGKFQNLQLEAAHEKTHKDTDNFVTVGGGPS
jgi:hypothetical protein